MPIISDEMKKAAKRVERLEKKRKEEEEIRAKEEAAKREQSEREAKEKEESENKQKKLERKQRHKEKREKERKEKAELERKANIRKELAFIRKTVGCKQVKDEGLIERQGITFLRTELMSGSFSKVYKAKQGDNDRVVCKVVILDKAPADYRQNLKEFATKVMRYTGGGTAEATTSTGGTESRHPGIVKVFDIFATDTKIYIFMEEVGVTSVVDKFKMSETPDENEVKTTIRQLAQVIKYLHGIGVAHNNIRPSHVVYGKDNQLKLLGMDMCSAFWDPDMENVLPKTRISKKEFDKKNHLPPEAFNNDSYDPSMADIWALGLIMCQILGKEHPFKIKNGQPFDDQWKTFAQTKQFSEEAKQLLDRIFVLDVPSRPNITDILEDPYLKEPKNPKEPKEPKEPNEPKDSNEPKEPKEAAIQ